MYRIRLSTVRFAKRVEESRKLKMSTKKHTSRDTESLVSVSISSGLNNNNGEYEKSPDAGNLQMNYIELILQ